MSDIEKLKADIAFLQEIEPLMEEFEAARAVKSEDPQRWHDAKNAFEPVRTYWREIAEYLAFTETNIAVDQIDSKAESVSPVANKGA